MVEVRKLMTELGLERDESKTWQKKAKEEELASYFTAPPSKKPTKEDL